jgi:hypothetical protein
MYACHSSQSRTEPKIVAPPTITQHCYTDCRDRSEIIRVAYSIVGLDEGVVDGGDDYIIVLDAAWSC